MAVASLIMAITPIDVIDMVSVVRATPAVQGTISSVCTALGGQAVGAGESGGMTGLTVLRF